MTCERFKEIDGFPNYIIGDHGTVKISATGKTMRCQTDKDGYQVIGLTRSGKQHQRKIHRLVAIHWLPNPDNKPDVDHINNDKTDNTIHSLQWLTREENLFKEIGRRDRSYMFIRNGKLVVIKGLSRYCTPRGLDVTRMKRIDRLRTGIYKGYSSAFPKNGHRRVREGSGNSRLHEYHKSDRDMTRTYPIKPKW